MPKKKKKRFVPKKGYDALADKYEQFYGDNPLQLKIVQWLADNLPKGSKILDVGCGTGMPVAKFLSEKGFQVTGIDNSPEMIKKARQNVPSAKFIEMNVKRLKIQEKFNAITAFFTLLHVQKELFPRVIKNLVGLLEEKGIFIISMVEGDFDEENLFLGQKMHYTAYPRKELENILVKAGLEIIFMKTQLFTPKIDGAEPETQLFFVCRKLS